MSLVSAIASVLSCRIVCRAVVFAGVLSGLSGCSDSENVPAVDPNDVVPVSSPDNMADFLISDMQYGTLVRLIEDADLAAALRGDNMGMGWTLFAPSDNAFVNEAFESMNPSQQVALVKLHLHSGRLAVADLVPGTLPMIEGSVGVEASQNQTVRVGGATIVARDRGVSNGIIHFVDTVLSPVQ